ncbi:L-aminoadipate-semialdehyde dehydrogenase-phosphopantetheinyl transferase isoform X1 [Maylandia zebra]|uniref:L-aminoadipate-semialdehyde dehydrogenase-phosphopantetheinyl transferase n=1 Tax=Astatotilapia calliptera TaxID=8154 RepID=A0A3P8QX45_ASTCA|nr:L-aminoadipate-semialdehyde dehydrogenase-phosphopantetheinyl transferase isoform X2 [Maylandia zebra]XP_026048649.1 L-aminoadipate-semialdehyde dehydrogenase-phosphopantetheinyl transferase isoform X1 [Astatotilapia calliptera]XP_039865174.1 L-aminoadipate-semialdehyde dehydrogenase-phosphopantetheinyl transferase [Simochromis diagramma]
MGSVRWAFRCGSWTPGRSDWLFAARCIQREEKDRIGQFVFAKDAKSAMAGRLLLRRLVCEKMGIPWSEIRLERSPRGKPYLATPGKVSSESDLAWSFNLSHQGDYAVLAAEQGRQVGVDIMKTAMPGCSSVLEFFRIMTRQFTAHEWSAIQSAGSEHQQLAAFYRHWALKESFIKAIGTGLGFNLQRVEFHLPSEPLTQDRVLHQTKMHLDEEEEEDWVFEESLLDADHHVAVALGPADNTCPAPRPPSLLPPTTFTVLSFRELIDSASPLTDEDPTYWDSFKMKAEAPQRQKDTHTST